MGAASTNEYLANLDDALDSPPDLRVYKAQLEGHLIDVRNMLRCAVLLFSQLCALLRHIASSKN